MKHSYLIFDLCVCTIYLDISGFVSVIQQCKIYLVYFVLNKLGWTHILRPVDLKF